MIRYVLDASVAAKWHLTEPDETLVAEALRLLALYKAAEARLFVPDLFFAEVASLLWKAERRGRCDPTVGDAALDQILALRLEDFPCRLLTRVAAKITRACGCTIYDGVYLALARQVDAPLITADERLVRAGAGYAPVLWLGAVA